MVDSTIQLENAPTINSAGSAHSEKTACEELPRVLQLCCGMLQSRRRRISWPSLAAVAREKC